MAVAHNSAPYPDAKTRHFLTQEVLAMALLLPGGHLSGLGGSADGAGRPVEGA